MTNNKTFKTVSAFGIELFFSIKSGKIETDAASAGGMGGQPGYKRSAPYGVSHTCEIDPVQLRQ